MYFLTFAWLQIRAAVMTVTKKRNQGFFLLPILNIKKQNLGFFPVPILNIKDSSPNSISNPKIRDQR
jgi:hypothetical protein